MVKNDFGSQPSELEAAPSDIVCQNGAIPSPAAEAPTFIGQDDEGVLEKVPALWSIF